VATGSDTCGDVTITESDVVVAACGNTKTITRTWTATDACGNSASADQIITVIDTIAPTFTVPADVTLECEIDVNDVSLTGDVIDEDDNCSTGIEATFSDSITEGDCPNAYVITRTWTLTDACGNSTSAEQTITVEDNSAPELVTELPTSVIASCDNIPSMPEPGFADNCSTELNIIPSETINMTGSEEDDYEIIREWEVTDECGNTAVFTQVVTITIEESISTLADSICFDDGIIDLNGYLTDIDETVSWEVVSGGASLDGSLFDPSNVALADYVFSYTFTEDSGCLSTTELTITVDDSCVVLACSAEDVVISKAVTPNGDSYNEFFTVTGVEDCGFTTEVQIFNRWGAKIYESNNYDNDWSGAAHKNAVGNADKVPTGTYFYIVKLRDSGLKPFTGPIYVGTK
jgi:gliding motility-associated-like protein